MRLIHYSKSEFVLKSMFYPLGDWRAKPTGLWVSVEGECDWKEWCEAEEYEIESLSVSYEVKLKSDANILYITTPEEVLNLSKEYPSLRPQWGDEKGRSLCHSYEIDWLKIKEEYQGIVIAPYQWDCRLHPESQWYYGWDCASGCIWDTDCIEELNLIESKKIEKKEKEPEYLQMAFSAVKEYDWCRD